MTPAVPDPTVEARIAEVLAAHPGWTDEVDEERSTEHFLVWRFRCSGRTCLALLQARKNADDAHREHQAAMLLAARAAAPDHLRDRLQALCDAAMRNKWHLGAEAVSLTVAQVLAVVGEDA